MGSTQHPPHDPDRVKAVKICEGHDAMTNFCLTWNIIPKKVFKFYLLPFAMRFKLEL